MQNYNIKCIFIIPYFMCFEEFEECIKLYFTLKLDTHHTHYYTKDQNIIKIKNVLMM